MNSATKPADIHSFFKDQRKTVLTFLGFSGAGYEEPEAMLKAAADFLDRADPKTMIVNIGATPDGIGAVYRIARERGFSTTGIVSTEALAQDVALSPYADHTFFVEDATWGGFIDGGGQLSPTSEIMVSVSDVIVAIGGGKVARDELLEARRRGKDVTLIPAEKSHALAMEKARDKKRPPPTDFRGAAELALAGELPTLKP